MGVQNLLKKHQILTSELTSHEARVLAVTSEAQAMVSTGHYGADDITARLEQLSAQWAELKVCVHMSSHFTGQLVDLRISLLFSLLPLPLSLSSSPLLFLSLSLTQAMSEVRQAALEASLQAQQYYSDAQGAESWMKEKEPLVSSGDYGKDEDSAQVSVNEREGACV